MLGHVEISKIACLSNDGTYCAEGGQIIGRTQSSIVLVPLKTRSSASHAVSSPCTLPQISVPSSESRRDEQSLGMHAKIK